MAAASAIAPIVANPGNLRLPFWLFNFEEIIDVFFGGRPGRDEEIEILSEVIPLAKVAYTQYRSSAERLAVKKLDPKSIGYTVDTPVPYRLQDLLMMIDERMGKLENRSSRMIYHKLITRIETVSNDARYAFLFENANVGGDTMAESISQLFRLPADGKPMTIMQLAGFPAEVVDSGRVRAVPAGLRFRPVERRREPAADRLRGGPPLRRRSTARSASARPGARSPASPRKAANTASSWRSSTQRPAELDPTIISQCSTLFAMRMSNDRDQALLRSAVSDAAANLFGFVPSLGTREALAFGVGVPLPTRLTFAELPPQLVPQERGLRRRATRPRGRSRPQLHRRGARALARLDGAQPAPMLDDAARETAPPIRPEAGPLQPAAAPAPPAAEPNRFSLLKKSLAQTDPYAALRSAISTQPKRSDRRSPPILGAIARLITSPLVPAKAETQSHLLRRFACGPWVSAFAATAECDNRRDMLGLRARRYSDQRLRWSADARMEADGRRSAASRVLANVRSPKLPRFVSAASSRKNGLEK